jgi:hypothetical protein
MSALEALSLAIHLLVKLDLGFRLLDRWLDGQIKVRRKSWVR